MSEEFYDNKTIPNISRIKILHNKKKKTQCLLYQVFMSDFQIFGWNKQTQAYVEMCVFNIFEINEFVSPN
jgi:hypothetical protein